MVLVWTLVWVSTNPWQSDLLYVEALFRDLFLIPHSLSGFQFSAATFVFPDQPLYGALRALIDILTPGSWSEVNLNWVLVGFMLAVQFVAVEVVRLWFPQQLRMLLVALPLFWLIGGPTLASQFYPVHHGAQWFCGLWIIFSVILYRPDWWQNLNSGAFWLTSFGLGLLASSDILFAVNALVPLALLHVWDELRGSRLASKRLGARTVASGARSESPLMGRTNIWLWFFFVGVSYLAFLFAYRALTGSHFGWQRPMWFPADRAWLFFQDQFLTAFPGVLNWISLVYLVVVVRKGGEYHQKIARYILVSIFVSALWAQAEAHHYFYPMSLAHLYVALHLIDRQKERRQRWAVAVVSILSFLRMEPLLDRFDFDFLLSGQSESVRCLDQFAAQTGKRVGIGSYWSAKYLTFFSQQNVRILQVQASLDPYYWINNREWYKDARPNFAIMKFGGDQRMQPQELIRKQPGGPVQIYRCGEFEIWDYPTNASLL